ncbi:MAG: hypothetical protein L0958_02685, partial [Candidatus Mariimomonas ferrooxydans]
MEPLEMKNKCRKKFHSIRMHFDRLLKKSSTALIAQIRKNDYADISRSFNRCNLIFYLCNQRLLS